MSAKSDTSTQATQSEQLQQAIRRTRAELGDTVEALAHKADVKGQVSEKLEERKQAARDKVAAVKEKLPGGAGGSGGDRSGDGGPAATEQVRDAAGQAATRTATVTRQRPLPTIAGVLVAGLVVGILIGRRR